MLIEKFLKYKQNFSFSIVRDLADVKSPPGLMNHVDPSHPRCDLA